MFSVNTDRIYQLQGDMSDAAFAKKLGVSRTQLWRVKNNKSNVGAEFLYKFKEAYPEESIDTIFFAPSVPLKEQQSVNGTIRDHGTR